MLILFVRYAWGIFFDTNYRPVEWEHARKMGLISKELIRLERNYPDKVRFFNWWFQVERLKRDVVPGDFAELGVYKGESAKIIHLMDASRIFHLYDTFEGFKEEDLKHETGEAGTYTTCNFADTSLEAVRRNIGGNESIVFHPGHFPESLVREMEPNDYRLTTADYRLISAPVSVFLLSYLRYFLRLRAFASQQFILKQFAHPFSGIVTVKALTAALLDLYRQPAQGMFQINTA